jgi:transcriptional antiterminator Rof (Rho-off)
VRFNFEQRRVEMIRVAIEGTTKLLEPDHPPSMPHPGHVHPT